MGTYKLKMIRFIVVLISVMGSGLSLAQRSLMDIHSWAYQLQGIDISQIANNSTFELIVMDYSADGSDDGKFTKEDILQIQNSGKKAICYISIGEAEDYRFYWDPNWDTDGNGIPDPGAPPWLGNVNPDWEGNYKVRFWQADWQEIIFTYIDTIVAQGFDGIYMDIIDAYYYWSEENGENPLADHDMVQFVLNIRDQISSTTNDEFFIIPQNGEFIIEEAHVSEDFKNDYLNAIDGIGVEDVFFIGEQDNNNPYNPDTERIDILRQYLSNGKPVFSVEYLTEAGLVQQYITVSGQHNYIPYSTVRDLNLLNDGIPTSIDNDLIVPQSFYLYQNYPNPFNGTTVISYQLSVPSRVELSIINTSGQKVRTWVDERQTPGVYSVQWDTRDASGRTVVSGVYLYRLIAGEFVEVRKMSLVR